MSSYICLGFVNSTSKKEKFHKNFIKFIAYHKNNIKNYCFDYTFVNILGSNKPINNGDLFNIQE